jgi:hypothetical protein
LTDHIGRRHENARRGDPVGLTRPLEGIRVLDGMGDDIRSAAHTVTRTREEWLAFAFEHDCCLEPVLDLDEARGSELVRAREMVVELDQFGVPVKLSRTPGDRNRRRAEVAAMYESGAVA